MKYTLNYCTLENVNNVVKFDRHRVVVQAESIPEACELLWKHVQDTKWSLVDDWTLFEENAEVGMPCWRVRFVEGRVSNGMSVEDAGDLQEQYIYVFKPLVSFTPAEISPIEYERVEEDWCVWRTQDGTYPTAGVLFDLTVAIYTEEEPLLSLREARA